MKYGKEFICAVLSLVVALSAAGCTPKKTPPPADNTPKTDTRNLSPQEYSIANLTAVDDYGRTVTVADPSGDDLYVGMFYFAWLGSQEMTGIYNVTELERNDRDALYNPVDTTGKSPAWQFHFESEPLYGYYSMLDPWVITRHVELFTMAGLDYICFDYTNAVQYNNVAHLVLNTLKKFKDQGWNVPRVMFYTNSYSANTVRDVYNEFYAKHGEYNELWFRFKGDDRPVIAGVSSNNVGFDHDDRGGSTDQTLVDKSGKPIPGLVLDANDPVYGYFNFYEAQWPSGARRDQEKGLPWMQWGTPTPHDNGNACVSVAQHGNGSVFYSDQLPASSRGYNGSELTDDWRKGANFQWQWDTVMRYKKSGMVKNVFVTGWNEWTAIKMPAGKYHAQTGQSWDGIPWGASGVKDPSGVNKEFYMVDDYNAEYSREVELGKEYGDSFYLQLVRNARAFKMNEAKRYKMRTKTIADITDFSVWDTVFVEYADFAGDAIARDHDGADSAAYKVGNTPHHYTDDSNRNDFVTIKATHDDEYIYVYAQTLENIEPPAKATDTNWMNLFISAGDTQHSFSGFNYVINRKPGQNGKTSVEKSKGGYDWQDAGEAEMYYSDNKIVYKIPLAAVGLTADNVQFSFKLADNVQKEDDILDYYVSGDCAPIGRFGYAYGK